jgi:hypothetical protein
VHPRTVVADYDRGEIDAGMNDDRDGSFSDGVPARGLEQALAAAQAGDEPAFVLLYRHLQVRLLRYATALAGQDADDVTAEAWLHITHDLRCFRGGLDPSAAGPPPGRPGGVDRHGS